MPESFIPDLSPENLEAERTRFADFVVDLAAHCANNAAFIAGLKSSLPPDFFELTGQGSTRNVYATKLGVAIKVQREDVISDPLPDAELKERGGDAYLLQLGLRRRLANLCELGYAGLHPRLVPRIYGFLASFGIMQSNPSVIICATARPLNYYLPGDGHGIKLDDMGVDEDGGLWIFDSRLTKHKRPAHLSPLPESQETDRTVWLGNIGVLDGRYLLIDRGSNVGASFFSYVTLAPAEWGWILKPTSEQNLQFSKSLFARYQKVWRAANPTERRTLCDEKTVMFEAATEASTPEPSRRVAAVA